MHTHTRKTASIGVRLQFSVGYDNAVDRNGYMYVELYKEADTGTLTYNGRTYLLDDTYDTDVDEDEYMWRMTSSFTLEYDTRYIVKFRYRPWNVSTGNYMEDLPLQICYVTSWDWTAANGSNATAEQVSAAFDAVSSNGITRNFSHLVFNELVDKVEKILFHLNVDWNVFFDTYNNTLMTDTENGRTLLALRYNSLRYQIGYIYGTEISDVSPGEEVIGQTHFINLVTKLNEWIDSLKDFRYDPLS